MALMPPFVQTTPRRCVQATRNGPWAGWLGPRPPRMGADRAGSRQGWGEVPGGTWSGPMAVSGRASCVPLLCLPPPQLRLVTREGGCVSTKERCPQKLFPSSPSEGRTTVPVGLLLSCGCAIPCPEHAPRPLPDGQGGERHRAIVRVPLPLHKVEEQEPQETQLSHVESGPCCLRHPGTPRSSGALPGPLGLPPEGQRNSGGLGDLRGHGADRPGQDLSRQLPCCPPPTILGFWAEASWLTPVPISRHLSCHRLLKNNPSLGWGCACPSEGG